MPNSKAIIIAAHGDPENLKLEDIDVPAPAPGEITIRVAAAGINRPDILQRKGLYEPVAAMAMRPGLEVSGIVHATESSEGRWQPGDRVVALCNGGGYAEYVNVPTGQVLPLPEGWRWQDAAALPETFFTIQQTLVDRAGISSGMTVLIHGASGGLGATAIQIAKLHGATVIASISSPEKAQYALSLGANHLVAYTHEDFVERTLAVTDGLGADRIIDIVGGPYLWRNIRAAAQNGIILQLGLLGGPQAEINMAPLLSKKLSIFGSILGGQPSTVKTEIARHLEEQVWPALSDGRIDPQRIETFALADAAEAHAAMDQSNHYGKIVLVTDFGASQDQN